ncbi:MAG TPA: TIR domain-containing protein [Pyrinomonadaceae bacterium]|nr:TIR domain-containing protein [Pyrinomonadaceae bacterium]
MAHDVFISYASEDFQVADRVRQALEEQGIKCWIAPRDVPYGSKYEEAILDGIATSPLLILVLSTHSNASPHVEREIQNACSEGSPTRIIPVRIDNIQYSKSLRYYLSSTQWLDASTPPLENHLQRLVEYVRSALPRGDRPAAATAVQTVIMPMGPRASGGETHTGTRDARERVTLLGGARSRTLMLAVGGALVAIGLIAVAAFVLTRDGKDDPPRVGNANEIVSVSPTPASTTPTPRTTPANTNQTPQPTPTPTPANPTPQPTPSPASPTPQPTPATTTPAVQPSPGGPRLPGLGSLLAQRLIEQAFSKDEELKSVKVSVKDGVVTLTGTVSSVRARDAAELIASTVKGVRKVDNQIEVK